MKTDKEIEKYKSEGLLKDVSMGDDMVGFLIDRMDDVVSIDDSEIFPAPPHLDEVEEALIEGVIKQGEELIILLDVTALLEKVMDACESA